MNETIEYLIRHGAAVLFAAVLVEQIGVTLTATFRKLLYQMRSMRMPQ